MAKTFQLSDESILRLKTIANISKNSLIAREVFLKNDAKSILLRTNIVDIPDDFEMAIFDVGGFLSKYLLFDNPVIDYTNLDNEGHIKIINKKEKGSKGKNESFTVIRWEAEEMKNNYDVEKFANVLKTFQTYNKFKILWEDIEKNIMKPNKVLGGTVVKLFTTHENQLEVRVLNHIVPNSDYFDITIEDEADENEINEGELFFYLPSDALSKLEKVSSYNIYMYKNMEDKAGTERTEKGECRFVMFENEEKNLKYIFTRMRIK